jgi:hypothetical protein
MEKDEYKTPVVFRWWSPPGFEYEGVIALFPTILETNHQNYYSWRPTSESPYPISCLSYEHIGQHGGADYDGIMSESRPATEAEYKDLFEELESIGYNLKVYQRRPKEV